MLSCIGNREVVGACVVCHMPAVSVWVVSFSGNSVLILDTSVLHQKMAYMLEYCPTRALRACLFGGMYDLLYLRRFNASSKVQWHGGTPLKILAITP